MNIDEIKAILEGSEINIPMSISVQEQDISNNSVGLEFFYENPMDMKSVSQGGLNLDRVMRPWPSSTINSKYVISGSEALNDIIYKPRDMYDYINKYYIDPYSLIPDRNPFKYSKAYAKKTIFDLKNVSTEMGQHQKFCSQYMSTKSDSIGLLVYHGLGSGKTVTALAIAEGNKAQYINDKSSMTTIAGRNKNCTITITVPKSLLHSYFKELIGSVQNGELKSWTGTCVIYVSDEKEDTGYRQYYTGTAKKDSNGKYILKNGIYTYEDKTLSKLTNAENLKNIYIANLNKLNAEYQIINKKYTGEKDKKDKIIENNREEYQAVFEQIQKKKTEIISLNNELKSKVSAVYFIVSVDTFIWRLYRMGTGTNVLIGKDNWGEISDEVKYGTTPHPDCFHSKNGVIIFDEIHGYVGEDTNGKTYKHDALYNISNIYARLKDGFPAMKIIALTATPIFDKTSEIGKIINLLRPRIPFPTTQLEFAKWFIKNKTPAKPKNTLLYRYMTSGYVSYFKGGNPNGYPYRRNHLMVHPISGYQAQLYESDLLRSFNNDTKNGTKKKSFVTHISNLLCALPEIRINVITEKDQRLPYIRAHNMYIKMQSIYNQTGRLEEVSKYFKEHAVKLHVIAHIIMNTTGNVFVFSNYIARGLLPLAYYLMVNGFKLLDKDTVNTGHEKSFGIYSNEASKEEFLKLGPEEEYKKKLLDLFSDPSNINGSKCRIILGKIEEGISFKNVKSIHLCDPWWNESKLEQIIGRGIRYLSHSMLPLNQQYVDVYYHEAVNSTYPSPNNEFKAPFNSRSIDQLMYSVAYKKSNIATAFEILTKETAIDYDLNAQGNLSRLEEMIIYKPMQGHNVPKFTVMINRSNGKYYTLIGKDVIEVNLITKEKIETVKEEFFIPVQTDNNQEVEESYSTMDLFDNLQIIDEDPSEESKINEDDVLHIHEIIKENNIWPPIGFTETNHILENYDINITKDALDRDMISIITPEILYNFNKNTNMNFMELMTYAISQGEEQEIWNKALEHYKRAKLMTMVIGIFGIYKMDPESSEMKNFITKNVNFIWNVLPQSLKKMMPYYRDHLFNIESIVQDQIKKELPEIARKFNEKYHMNVSEFNINTKEKLQKFNMDQVKFMADSISVKDKIKKR